MALQRPRGREDFREKLGDLYGSCDPRWCVAGDFNVIFDSPKEKASDGRITSSMRVFNKFIDDLLSLVRSILVLVVELQQGLIGSYSSRIGLIGLVILDKRGSKELHRIIGPLSCKFPFSLRICG